MSPAGQDYKAPSAYPPRYSIAPGLSSTFSSSRGERLESARDQEIGTKIYYDPRNGNDANNTHEVKNTHNPGINPLNPIGLTSPSNPHPPTRPLADRFKYSRTSPRTAPRKKPTAGRTHSRRKSWVQPADTDYRYSYPSLYPFDDPLLDSTRTEEGLLGTQTDLGDLSKMEEGGYGQYDGYRGYGGYDRHGRHGGYGPGKAYSRDGYRVRPGRIY
ncbi:uncharacterized protein C8A04DRAFT_25523 [Dichotomopilus funicola]|uniref:Uncharacterized protein n=1 Tax=Dichotomopilus funicola TaxID=1934379 RepID=A0AAN6V8C5_9PEZI|nr:hypothetical protein C8A04DRAFT_25523 [Dichotomopilus funicola]